MDEANNDVASTSCSSPTPSLLSPSASTATATALLSTASPNFETLPNTTAADKANSLTHSNVLKAAEKLSQLALDSLPPSPPKLHHDSAPPQHLVNSPPVSELEKLRLELAEAKRLQEEEKRLRQKAEEEKEEEKRLRQEAEERARPATVRDVREYLDRLLLNDMTEPLGWQDQPPRMSSLKQPQPNPDQATHQSTRRKLIPHELCYDQAMRDDIAKLGRILESPLIRDRATNLPVSWLQASAKETACQPLRLEASFEYIWLSKVVPPLKAVLNVLDALVSTHRATKASQEQHNDTEIIDQVVALFPHVPWGEVTDKIFWSKELPSTLVSQPRLPSINEGEEAHHTAEKTTQASRSHSSKPCTKTKSAAGSGSSDKPSSEFGSIRSDIFTSFQDQSGDLLLYFVTELKALSSKNSKKAETFFRASVDLIRLLEALEDGEMINVTRQCFTYMCGHSCAHVHLNIGLTHVFFRYHHVLRKQALAKLAAGAKPPRIQLHYYVVSMHPIPPQNEDSKQKQDEGEKYWRQGHALLDALLCSLLHGLNDRFATTDDERTWWTTDLGTNAYVCRDSSSQPSSPQIDQAPAGGGGKGRKSDDDRGAPDAEGYLGRGSRGRGGGRQGPAESGSSGGQGNTGNSRHAQAANDAGREKGGGGAGGASVERAGRMRRVLGEIDTNVARPLRPSAAKAHPRRLYKTKMKPALTLSKPQQSGLRRQQKTRAKVATTQPVSAATAVAKLPGTVGADINTEWDGTPRYGLRCPDLITRHWCTPACLAGLKYGLAMDPDCPNAALHCTIVGCNDHAAHKHPHSLERIRADMQAKTQPEWIWRMMEPIVGCNGVTAQLFRFLHVDLGYAFAAKGMHACDAHYLRAEHDKYEYLANVTNAASRSKLPTLGRFRHGRVSVSVHVAVSCGIIEPSELTYPYPLWPLKGQFGRDENDDIPIYNMWLLLSYHSLNLKRPDSQHKLKAKLGIKGRAETASVLKELKDWCEQRLLNLGIEHNDLHLGNMLWCQKLNAVVLIDFERADYATV